ncbi:MAG: NAD(+)/NADH kinase [Methyloceanibacter sp.]|nr:NAD(+)/NADH kinase [Methyloceanibacter sp.]
MADPIMEPQPLTLLQSGPVTVAVRRVAALMNAGAGAFSQALAEDVESALRASFVLHDVEADISFVEGEGLHDAVERALMRAQRGEIDAIVIGGGDGSMRTAASVLAGTDVPLGTLPLGTLNHFAKDLGIPLQVEEAAATIAAGRTRVVDLAEVNGETFINNSSIGIYPYMVIDRERRREAHKLAKWMAMVPAFFRMMRHFPRRRLRISAQGFARPYRTPCLFVGNNEYGMELFTFGRRQRLDTGKLWFYVVKPRKPLEFFWMVCRLCFGRMDQARDLDTFQLADAEIGAKTSRLPVAFDGEVKIMHTPLRYRSRPRALRVIVPEARLTAGARARWRAPA